MLNFLLQYNKYIVKLNLINSALRTDVNSFLYLKILFLAFERFANILKMRKYFFLQFFNFFYI